MYDMIYGDLAPENTLCGLPPRGVEPGTALFFDYTFSGLLKAGSAQLSPVGRPRGSRRTNRYQTVTTRYSVLTVCQQCANTSFGVSTPGVLTLVLVCPTVTPITKKVC